MSADTIRSSSPWLAFTGLIPVLIMVPILLMHAYAVGVIVAAAGCVAVVFYSLLALQSAVSLVRGDPWTMQFTRRVVAPEFLTDPRFRAMNVRTTAVWAIAFAICDALSLLLHGATSNWLPVAVMAAAVVISRISGRVFLASALGRDEQGAAAAATT
jgi:hypothetical protein